MTKMVFLFLAFVSVFLNAKENIPSNATQTIFESLVKSVDKDTAIKAPMTIEASNIICSIGSAKGSKMKCVADFNIQNKKETKEILNSEVFYNYLNARHAISMNEVMVGGNHYKTNKLKCTYSSDSGVYYVCFSDLTVRM